MLWIEKRLVLLVTFLALGLWQHWVGRAVDAVDLAPRWKTVFLMACVIFSYTIAAEVVTPRLQGLIKKVHGSLKPARGAAAGILVAIVLLALLFFGYFKSRYPHQDALPRVTVRGRT